jgi:hypothetical protein
MLVTQQTSKDGTSGAGVTALLLFIGDRGSMAKQKTSLRRFSRIELLAESKCNQQQPNTDAGGKSGVSAKPLRRS